MSSRSRRSHTPHPQHESLPDSSEPLSEGGAGHRHARLEHLVCEELQRLITDEARDPALDGIEVLAVHLSFDAGQARVPYVVRGPLALEAVCSRDTRAALARANAFLRTQLALQLDLKKVPKLAFTFVGMTGPAPEGGEPCPE
jgi:ribosome-binding factor A